MEVPVNKYVALGLLTLGVAAIAIPASADPPAAPTAPATTASASASPATSASASPAAAPSAAATASDGTIRGRADKPNVLIELQRQTPASAARVAHEQMRQAWIARMKKAAQASRTP